jgi:OmpA-OmpF porin, OOP family
MKKLLFAFLPVFACLHVSYSQDNDYIKRPAVGINLFYTDFKGAAFLRQNGFGIATRENQLNQFKQMDAGVSVSYISGFTSHFDVAANLGGSFLDYPIPNHVPFASDNLLLEADLSLRAKMFTDKYWINPYLSAGIGGSKYLNYYGAFMPVGVGLQVNLFDEAFVFINSQYRIAISENTAYHLYHSIGIAGNIGKTREPKIVPPPPLPVVEPPKDRDNDGIADSLDACPDVAGLARYQGCPIPDRDKDGINDEEDKCPDVAGLARYQGCPIPDRDKDGINDEEDKCPDVAGVARYQGCPVPDRDKDGVNDEEDKCPDLPGEAANEGCPVIKAEVVKRIEYAAKNIFFATAKYTLLSKSNKSLNEVVQILNENKDLKLDIDGYTDNKGKEDKNRLLSQKRSDAVKNYLVKKGVEESRLASTGHGSDAPVANNKTAAGRARNRRVEMHLKYY